MFDLFFKKIDKSKYPKVVRKWAWSVIFVYPAFVIINKLWPFLYLYIVLNLINFVLMLLNVDKYIVNLASIVVFAIFIFFTIYLLIYGRILSWQKLGYKNNDQDIAKFKLRQRIVLYINIVVLGLIAVYFFSWLEYGHWISILGKTQNI